MSGYTAGTIPDREPGRSRHGAVVQAVYAVDAGCQRARDSRSAPETQGL